MGRCRYKLQLNPMATDGTGHRFPCQSANNAGSSSVQLSTVAALGQSPTAKWCLDKQVAGLSGTCGESKRNVATKANMKVASTPTRACVMHLSAVTATAETINVMGNIRLQQPTQTPGPVGDGSGSVSSELGPKSAKPKS